MNVVPRLDRDNFDSKLEIPHADRAANVILRLELRILLVRIDTTTFRLNGHSYHCRHWTNREWDEFVFLYRHTCEHYWNNRFWLQPPDSFSELDLPLGRPTHRPNVLCQLRMIMLRSNTDRRHHRIRVVHLANDEHFMRSNDHTYDNLDIRPRNIDVDLTDSTYVQIPAVHEVAHLLGLHHPGVGHYPECSTDGNRDICYGRNGRDRDQITGSGMAFTDRHAQPWLDRMGEHTHTRAAAWTLLHRDTPPRSLAVLGIQHRAADRMRDRLIHSVDGL